MYFKEMFNVGEIMQSVSRTKAGLDLENCKIISKMMNNKSVILKVKREDDGKEANVFVKLKDEFIDKKEDFKKLFASKGIIGMSLNELKNSKVEDL